METQNDECGAVEERGFLLLDDGSINANKPQVAKRDKSSRGQSPIKDTSWIPSPSEIRPAQKAASQAGSFRHGIHHRQNHKKECRFCTLFLHGSPRK